MRLRKAILLLFVNISQNEYRAHILPDLKNKIIAAGWRLMLMYAG